MTIVMIEIKSNCSGMVGIKVWVKGELTERNLTLQV